MILSLPQYSMLGALAEDNGVFNVRKFGRNTDVDAAAAEDIWDGGGTYVPPTAARVHALVSGSAADAAAGTGARTVRIYGLDANWNLQDEVVTLDGTTPVNTVGSYLRVFRMKITSAGTGGVNAGLITATAATDSTISAAIAVGKGQTLMAVYSTPANYTSHMSGVWFGINRNSPTAQTATCSLWVKEGANSATAAWTQKLVFILDSDQTAPYHHPMNICTLTIPEKSDIRLTATVTANNFDISAGFCLTALRS